MLFIKCIIYIFVFHLHKIIVVCNRYNKNLNASYFIIFIFIFFIMMHLLNIIKFMVYLYIIYTLTFCYVDST